MSWRTKRRSVTASRLACRTVSEQAVWGRQGVCDGGGGRGHARACKAEEGRELRGHRRCHPGAGPSLSAAAATAATTPRSAQRAPLPPHSPPPGELRQVLPIALEVTTPGCHYVRIHRRFGTTERQACAVGPVPLQLVCGAVPAFEAAFAGGQGAGINPSWLGFEERVSMRGHWYNAGAAHWAACQPAPQPEACNALPSAGALAAWAPWVAARRCGALLLVDARRLGHPGRHMCRLPLLTDARAPGRPGMRSVAPAQTVSPTPARTPLQQILQYIPVEENLINPRACQKHPHPCWCLPRPTLCLHAGCCRQRRCVPGRPVWSSWRRSCGAPPSSYGALTTRMRPCAMPGGHPGRGRRQLPGGFGGRSAAAPHAALGWVGSAEQQPAEQPTLRDA